VKKERFGVPDLIRIFQASLVALIPVAERARIAWNGPAVHDPWEDIERTLFSSIVGSVVENMVPSPPRSLPSYGLIHPTYADQLYHRAIGEAAREPIGFCPTDDRRQSLRYPTLR
jgi:hypothetical protein